MKNKSQGFSIVEAMIAITLGLILVIGVLYLFASNKQTYLVQSGIARIQENGRYAKFILSDTVRMAGFQGCPKLARIAPQNLLQSIPANTTFTLDTVLTGYDGGSTLPTWITSNLASGTQVAAGTDVIVVRKASPVAAALTADMATGAADIQLTDKLSLTAGNILLISDCQSGDIFKASTGTSNTQVTHKSGDNNADTLTKAYLSDARVYQLETYVYYIKDTGRKNQAGQSIFGLYRQGITGVEEELFDGIENMQITYGLDTNNDNTADTYQTATQVSGGNNWSKVVSVDIALLLSSVENVSASPQSYTYLGSVVTPTDKQLRRQWDGFIMLRNRS